MTAEVITKRDEDALEFLSDVRLELLEDATVRRLLRHSPLPHSGVHSHRIPHARKAGTGII